MGIVYLAEQREPVRRRVALKVLKSGDAGSTVLARFESESQALALMDHPNIARVHDAGTTSTGRPYFAMEYVPGIPITDYCDRNLLGFRERLALFQQVCQAVHHAHQKGIIHRDLKPSNVLVMLQDGKPVPKVIDFGVAKAVNQRLVEKTLFTEIGMLIGTPEYMSPEQADLTGLDVDLHHGYLFVGRAALRIIGRRAAVRFCNAAEGRIRRDPARDPGGGTAQAFQPAQHHGSSGAGSGAPPAKRCPNSGPSAARRSGMDHDEGVGEGPDAAVCVGVGLRRRHRPAPGERARIGGAAIAHLPSEEGRPPESRQDLGGRGGVGGARLRIDPERVPPGGALVGRNGATQARYSRRFRPCPG